MKAITIRGIEPAVSLKLKQMAEKENKSMNQLVLDLIHNSLGMQKSPRYTRQFTDLDHLFGSWSEDEFQDIQGRIENQRQIDLEMWE